MDILDQTLVNEPALDQTLVTEPAVELECEQGSDDTSSNSSFKSIGLAEEEEALAEDQSDSGMYHDAEPPVESDDVDYDQQDDVKADDGLQQPYLGGRGRACHPFGPYCDPQQMWEPHRGRVSHSCGPHGWDTCQGPRRLWSWQTRDENENMNEGNSSSLLQSDLGEVSPAMVGAGLYNLGNTCFLNAILQCFTHTVPLVEGLRSYNHPKPCELDSEGFCVFCALHNHIEIAITAKGKSLSPLKLVENLDKLSSDFRRYQQEDAHELLQSLLDKLDRCCNKSETDDSDENLVQRLFGGRLVSKLKCCNCGHCSDTFESLIDLSLEIENASSLPSALESFTKVEKIEDEEPQFECESCKEKVAVEKQLMVDHAPSIAAFHLKRFKNDGSRVEKIDKHVEFPLELDLKPYTNGSQNDNVDLNYSLYAIVVHSGFSPTSGHYFCFVRSAPDAWYRLDDSQVARVSESHVLSRDAYILLYAKNGTPWFSTFMETEKLTMDCNVSSTSPKSVLENPNQNSESSPIMEANIISEVNEEDRKESKIISGLSLNNSRHEDEIGVAKVDSKIGKKLFPSSVKDDNSVISSTSFKSVFDIDETTESSRTMETNIIADVHEEDRRDAMEISRVSLDDCGGKYCENVAKDDSKIETNLPSPAHNRGDNSNQKDGKFMKSANSNSSTSRKSSSPIGISRLSFNDYALEDRVDGAQDDSKVEKKPSPSAFRGEVEKSVDVGSSTPSANPYSIRGDHAMTERELPCKRQSSTDLERKEAYRLVKSMPCSKRRLQLLAVVNSNPEVCSNNKRTKINKPSSSRKDGPSNALRNPNLVSLRRPVAPGRFR